MEKEKIKTLIKQVLKFGVVGVLNTGIDFAILNLLMWIFKTYSGTLIIVFNIIAFTLAVINSYFLNRYWTFKVKSRQEMPEEFTKFISVSIVGVIINSGIVYLITTIIGSQFGLADSLWANAAKIAATGVALVWNFVGYKFWAFKNKADQE